MNEVLAAQDISLESLVAQLADEFRERLERGERPAIEEYVQRHPQHAGVIRNLLTALEFMRLSAPGSSGIGASSTDSEPASPLGDYRIIREIGRGGMGVVYEAEQLSLARRVALKVLPFAAALDAKQLQRFKNEAQAAACLHHPNIVPVYAVGCARGVHYFAMQFIDGQTIAAVIEELRGLARPRPAGQEQPFGPTVGDEVPNRLAAPQPTGPFPLPSPQTQNPQGDGGRQTADVLTTHRSNRAPAFFRSVAQLGIQAAEALDHAHQFGVVHRDIKPANLLVDARGHLWVTDFGLAHVQSDTRLTLTGDILGTLRYMSPEQALGQRRVADPRSDVYSLGVTLYELLTLEPAFPGNDRQGLLRQIAFEEPRPPRRINKSVPADLETIILKALAKEPHERYATAQELADDLERFLKEEPIRGRRPTLARRARKWCRRHRPWVAAGAALLLITLVLGSGVAWQQHREQVARLSDTEREVAVAKALNAEGWKQTDDPDRWQATVALARSAMERAEGLLARGGGTEDLAEQVRQARAAVDQADRASRLRGKLDRIRLEMAATTEGRYSTHEMAPRYTAVLGEQGIDLASPRVAAERVRADPLREVLVAALEDWKRVTPKPTEWRRLKEVLSLVEPAPDDFRARWRTAIDHRDGPALAKLARGPHVQGLPAAALVNMERDLREVSELPAAEQLLRAGHERFPNDFWLNHDLGTLLGQQQPPQAEDAVRFLTAALTLRAGSAGVYSNLGNALKDKGDLDGAIRCYRKALELGAPAHLNLGVALKAKGDVDGAIRWYHKAIELNPKNATAHTNLGNVLRDKGDVKEAIRCYGTALDLNPKYVLAHNELGIALQRKGDLDGAIRSYRKAIEVEANFAGAHNNLGGALREKGNLNGALVCLRTAIKLNPKFVEAHDNLGMVLQIKGDVEGAIHHHRSAIDLNPKYAKAHCNLGSALRAKGDLDGAIRCHRTAIDLDPRDATAHYNLGLALYNAQDLDGAVRHYRSAINLNPEHTQAHGALGEALLAQGHFAEARTALREAKRLLPAGHPVRAPVSRLLQECEDLLALDAKLPALLDGGAKPANTAEAIGLARLCLTVKKRWAAAARFYADAFRLDPKLAEGLSTEHRYHAACAAALAGCGQGKDAGTLDAKEKARLRKQALDWLRADLTQYGKFIDRGPDQARAAVERLRHWQQNTDLAVVRDDGLVKLPEAEWQPWCRLWADVEQTIVKARAKEPPGENAGKRP